MQRHSHQHVIIISVDNKVLCGLDEAGRGALAGPLVAAAVAISNPAVLASCPFPVRDSKVLTQIQRENVVTYLKTIPVSYSLEIVSVTDINEKGIGWANKIIFEKLIDSVSADEYIVDGNLKLDCSKPYLSQIKADSNILPVTLAGIIAKVHRDGIMKQLHHLFPHYHWQSNKGYGTPDHAKSLLDHGLSPHHRTLFVKTLLSKFTA